MDNNFLKIKLWDPTPSPTPPTILKMSRKKKAAIATNPREYTINQSTDDSSIFFSRECL